MSSGMMKVGFGQLEAGAADIQSAAARIDARLNELEGQLNALRGDWTGQASEAYQVAKKQWDTAMADMRQLLAGLGQAVSQSNQDYQATERGNAGMFGG